ncbi:DUF4767 domain-containing protein [Enterococcus sp. 5H]|uniref:DUF4767 domain-containing protein n=1 Tax=Enterococcus sp. 5H TaxID=1229490 RepID=UPI002302F10A|nr:DUF4767 domain-containing protein [Enterococcus sp. 5H]MDA9470919.1 hypothetical protein [Enterococcus sp. 5H]
MKKIVLVSLAGLGILLAGCQSGKNKETVALSTSETAVSSSSMSSSSSSQSSSTTQEKVKESTTTATSSQEIVKEELWNSTKSQELNIFMAQWGQTMDQVYKEYSPGNNVNLYGLQLPDGILNNENGWQASIGEVPISVTWSENGQVSDGYALVAVYSDAESQPYLKQHVYFFTIQSDGTPAVLVTMQNQGNENNYLYFRETDNQELKNGFTELVTRN